MPYVSLVILTYVSVKGGIVQPYKCGFFDCSNKVLALAAQGVEVVWCDGVAWWPYIGKAVIRCSMSLSSNILADSPTFSLLHSSLLHMY